MRILYVLTQDLESPSGLGRYWPLARQMAALGHQVTVAALHGDYDHLEQGRFEREGVQIVYTGQMHVLKQGSQKSYFPARKLLAVTTRATWTLSRVVLSHPADIVHLGKPHPMNGVAGLLARTLQGKTLFVDLDDYEAGSNRFSGAWQRRGVAWFEDQIPRKAHHLTTHTQFVLNRLLSSGIPAERITYLPNGVDADRFAVVSPEEIQRLRQKLGLEGKKVILYIGSMSLPSHPVDLLLKAFKTIKAKEPHAFLLLVGGGEDLAGLQQLAYDLGIAGSTNFCGRVPPEQVPLYYRLADVSAEPVYDDDAARGRSPLKMFESWISEVPFVTADVGDRAWLAGSPSAALLAPPGDAQALGHRILEVLTNPGEADFLRNAGRERVQSFLWSRLSRDLEGVYRRYSQVPVGTEVE